MESEQWKDIPGYEDLYKVSNLGRVLSVRRDIILKPGLIRDYRSVVLCNHGKRVTMRVHQLIAVAFLNHKPSGMNKVVDHIDGNKENNKLSNLQILSHRGNIQKADRKNKSSKFTGVTFHKGRQMYRAYVNVSKKQIHLGFYQSEIEASKAYQDALKKYNLI
jgi:hypothetical protein